MPEDDESYVAFVTARWPALYRTAYLLTGSAPAAEDALQTTLAKAFATWRRVRGMDAPEAYVRRMLVNTVISDRRRRDFALLRGHPGRREPSVEPGDEAVLARSDLWPRIRALPPRQRAVVVLRYYEDLSERQIAEVLGCSAGTVKSQASDALKALRRSMASETDRLDTSAEAHDG